MFTRIERPHGHMTVYLEEHAKSCKVIIKGWVTETTSTGFSEVARFYQERRLKSIGDATEVYKNACDEADKGQFDSLLLTGDGKY